MRTKNSGLFGSLDLGSIDLHDCSDGNDHTQSGDDGRFFAEKNNANQYCDYWVNGHHNGGFSVVHVPHARCVRQTRYRRR